MSSPEFSVDEIYERAIQLPVQVLPIFNYVHAMQPDGIFVADRGGRPLGYAIERMFEAIKPLDSFGEHFYYRRISKALRLDELTEHLREPLEAVRRDTLSPRLLLLDDRVSKSAGTLFRFSAVLSKLGIRGETTRLQTMVGKGNTDHNVRLERSPVAPIFWLDNPAMLGICYEGTTLHEEPSLLSEALYGGIREGVKRLAEVPVLNKH